MCSVFETFISIFVSRALNVLITCISTEYSVSRWYDKGWGIVQLTGLRYTALLTLLMAQYRKDIALIGSECRFDQERCGSRIDVLSANFNYHPSDPNEIVIRGITKSFYPRPVWEVNENELVIGRSTIKKIIIKRAYCTFYISCYFFSLVLFFYELY